MYKIVAKLKQHTPMIHFHCDRDNISLRASDFKPRFDKYLLTLEKYYSGEELKKCLPGIDKLRNNMNSTEKKKALYSARFGPLINIKKTRIPPRTLYFGDITEVIESGGVELTIVTQDKDVQNIVLKGLPIFFALENFGTRQNKGFGSFTIEKITVNSEVYTFESIENIYKRKKMIDIYSFEVNGIMRDVFMNIKHFYNTLKGGINFDDSGIKYYSKSLLLRYFRQTNPDLAWEKLLMKMYLKEEPIETDNKLFVRGVLGLSDTYTFRPKPNVRVDPDLYKNKRVDITTDRSFKIAHITDRKEKIVRAPSPLCFKPIKKDDSSFIVYVLLKEELYKDEKQIDIREEKFEFNEGKNKTASLEIDKKFELNEFMKFVKVEFDDNNNPNLTTLIRGLTLTKVNNLTEAGNQ